MQFCWFHLSCELLTSCKDPCKLSEASSCCIAQEPVVPPVWPSLAGEVRSGTMSLPIGRPISSRRTMRGQSRHSYVLPAAVLVLAALLQPAAALSWRIYAGWCGSASNPLGSSRARCAVMAHSVPRLPHPPHHRRRVRKSPCHHWSRAGGDYVLLPQGRMRHSVHAGPAMGPLTAVVEGTQRQRQRSRCGDVSHC